MLKGLFRFPIRFDTIFINAEKYCNIISVIVLHFSCLEYVLLCCCFCFFIYIIHFSSSISVILALLYFFFLFFVFLHSFQLSFPHFFLCFPTARYFFSNYSFIFYLHFSSTFYYPYPLRPLSFVGLIHFFPFPLSFFDYPFISALPTLVYPNGLSHFCIHMLKIYVCIRILGLHDK